MTSLLGIYYAVFLRHGTAPILRSQIFSKSTARSRKISVLAAKDFSVVFDKPSLDRRHTLFHVPLSHQLIAEDKDFGGLEIRFFEDLDQRQKGRLIYHDFQNDWGVAKLKSGPNDGTLYAVGCKQDTFDSVHSDLLGLGSFCMMVLVATAILTCFFLCFSYRRRSRFLLRL